MKNALILSALLTLGPVCFAQQTEKYPLGNYEELTDTKPHDGAEVWNKMTTPTCLSWGTTDIRYKKTECPRHQEDNPLARESLERGTHQCTSRVVD